jgi:hypothetical protein
MGFSVTCRPSPRCYPDCQALAAVRLGASDIPCGHVTSSMDVPICGRAPALPRDCRDAGDGGQLQPVSTAGIRVRSFLGGCLDDGGLPGLEPVSRGARWSHLRGCPKPRGMGSACPSPVLRASARRRWHRSARLLPNDRGIEVAGAVTNATFTGHVHDAASTLSTASLLVAALAGALRRSGSIRVLTLALVVTGIACSVTLLAIGDPVPGIRQRVLLATGCLWQIAWLLMLRAETAPTSPGSSGDSRCSTS